MIKQVVGIFLGYRRFQDGISNALRCALAWVTVAPTA